MVENIYIPQIINLGNDIRVYSETLISHDLLS